MTTEIRYSLPANHRVKLRRDFLQIRDSGRLIRCSHFLVILSNRSTGPTRLGVTVTRKIGGAVVRNRIKRYLREFFRLDYQHLPPATDISIIAKRGAEKLSFKAIQRELQKVLLSSRGFADR